MTDRKEKLAVLADYAEELGLADVAKSLRVDLTPKKAASLAWADGYAEAVRHGSTNTSMSAMQLVVANELRCNVLLSALTDTTASPGTR